MVNYQNLTCNLAWTKVRDSRAKLRFSRTTAQQPRTANHGPRTTNRGYCGRFSVSFGL